MVELNSGDFVVTSSYFEIREIKIGMPNGSYQLVHIDLRDKFRAWAVFPNEKLENEDFIKKHVTPYVELIRDFDDKYLHKIFPANSGKTFSTLVKLFR